MRIHKYDDILIFMRQQVKLRRPIDVAKVVVTARRARGLTQAELAARARVSTRWLSLFENGKSPGADLSRVLGVLAALGVDVVGSINVAGDDE